MSVTTIQIPIEQVNAIRESLATARSELIGQPPSEGQSPGSATLDLSGRLEEINQLFEQMEGSSPSGSDLYPLTGSRSILWEAVYDVLCGAAERFAEDCNEYWRGATDPYEVRRQIAGVSANFELLDLLGPPPEKGRG